MSATLAALLLVIGVSPFALRVLRSPTAAEIFSSAALYLFLRIVGVSKAECLELIIATVRKFLGLQDP